MNGTTRLMAQVTIAMCALLLAGCMSARQNASRSSTTAASVSASSAAVADVQYSDPATTCGLGTFDSVFDDFSYNRTGVGERGSPFGDNDWSVCSDSTVKRYDSRFWYRFNPWDVGLNDARIEVTGTRGDTRILLIAEETHVRGNHAMIRSGMGALGGTWVARVKLPELSENADMIAAFWTQQAEYFGNRHEIDFEFNNIWGRGRRGHPVLQVAVHRDNPSTGGKNQSVKVLDCEYIDASGSTRRQATDCFDDQTSGNYFLGKYTPAAGKTIARGEEEEFFTLIIRQYGTDRVEYAGLNSDYRGTGDIVRAGPESLDRFVPTKPMQTMFGLIPRKIDTPNGQLGEEFEMAVDWVYYSPDEELLEMSAWEAIDAVESEVQTFRDGGWSRINTAGTLLFPPPLPRPD